MFTVLELPGVRGSNAETWNVLRNQENVEWNRKIMRNWLWEEDIARMTWKICGFTHLHIVTLEL